MVMVTVMGWWWVSNDEGNSDGDNNAGCGWWWVGMVARVENSAVGSWGQRCQGSRTVAVRAENGGGGWGWGSRTAVRVGDGGGDGQE